MKLTVNDLYDLTHTKAADYLKQFTYPWEALEGIKNLILEIGAGLSDEEYDTIAGLVIQLLDRIPEEREKPTVSYKNLDIKVLQVQERTISKVLIHINPIVEDEEEQEDDEKEE